MIKASGKIAKYALIAGLICPFLTVGNAFSQPNIGQATRETDRPVREKIEEKLITPPKKPPVIKETPKEEAPTGPKFFIKEIELLGVESFPKESFANILKKYEGREVALSEIKDILTKDIEREYLKRGVIAACFVPPQEVKDGKIAIRVVEAKMGDLQVKKHRYYNNSRVKYYWTTKPGEVLNYAKISRSLQFMNKNPDREVKATLHAGKKPGTTDVILDPKTYFPLHLTGTLDLEGAPSTGKLRKGIGIVENNLLGLDDTMISGYTGGKDFGGAYAYHRVPVSNFGTTALYGYSLTRAFPKKDIAPFEMTSASEGYSAFIYQDLYTKDEYRGEVSVGIDAKNKRVVTYQGTLNADRLRILRTGLSLLNRGAGNVTYMKGEVSQGLNWLGARRLNEFSSRDGSNTYTKFVGNATFKQSLAKNFQASLKISGQVASERLTPQEEFYMGGIDSVRGYPSGDYLADTGYVANLELLVPAFFLPQWLKVPYGERPIKDDITGVAFFDCGYGMKRGEIQGEDNKFTMASAGLGVRIKLLNQATLRMEWGFVLKDIANRPISENPPYRFHFALDFQDRLPREVDRLKELLKEDYIKDSAWDIVNDEMHIPGSRLSESIYQNMRLAKAAEAKGDLRSAKKYYAKVSNVGRAAYKQAEIYVKNSYEHIDELKAMNAQAERFYEAGEILKAKEMWQKVKEGAKIKPLIIEVPQ